MRKLATVREISAIKSIPDADRIVAYQVDGWWVVDQKDKYAIGDTVVYCEVDSWVPHDIAPFLSKGKEPREFNGVKGEKLRTIKLKKQLSQGLLLPKELFLEKFIDSQYDIGQELSEVFYMGADVSDILGIQKWEPQIPIQLAGVMKGLFPSFIPKTDQERVQNLVEEIKSANSSQLKFEVTEKLEGSSMTCYLVSTEEGDTEFGVCSRNIDLKQDETNTFWKTAIDLNIEIKMKVISMDFAIQGELIGPGIQGNIYNLDKVDFYVFDIYDIISGKYLDPKTRREIVEVMGLNHIPVLEVNVTVDSVDGCITKADGQSVIGSKPIREGLVWKEMNGGMTFKAISNEYLSKVG